MMAEVSHFLIMGKIRKFIDTYAPSSVSTVYDYIADTNNQLSSYIPVPSINRNSLVSSVSDMPDKKKNPLVPENKRQHRLSGTAMAGANVVHKKARCVLPFVKGIGYTKPGPIFTPYKERVEVEFAFELGALLNKRNLMRMGFRTYHQGLRLASATQLQTAIAAVAADNSVTPKILAEPAVAAVVASPTTTAATPGPMMLTPELQPRTIGNGFNFNIAVRDATNCYRPLQEPGYAPYSGAYSKSGQLISATDCYYPPVGLYDLECYSWNNNPFKYVNWHAKNGQVQALQANGSNITPMNVFKDVQRVSAGSRQTFSPFRMVSTETSVPDTSSVATQTFVKKFENFLCDLGPGSIDFHILNKYNTPCVVEFVVVQLRKDGKVLTAGSFDTAMYTVHEEMIRDAYMQEFNSGNFINSVGFGGEAPSPEDPMVNPNKPFLKAKRKYMVRDPPTKEVCRERHIIAGASKQQLTIHLPEVTYDAVEHRLNSVYNGPDGTPGLNEAAIEQAAVYTFQPHSYCIYVSVQGTIMPVFGATIDANQIVTSVNEQVVDTQTCAARILVHAKYVEHPRKCVSVSPTYALQLRPELHDTVLTNPGDPVTKTLVAGYMPGLPVPTTTQTVVSTSVGQKETSSGA